MEEAFKAPDSGSPGEKPVAGNMATTRPNPDTERTNVTKPFVSTTQRVVMTRDAVKQEERAAAAGPSLRKILNGLNTKKSLMVALLEKPGFNGEIRDMAQASNKIQEIFAKASKLVFEKIPFTQDHPFDKALIARSLSDLIGQVWVATDNPDPVAIAEMYIQFFDSAQEVPNKIFEDIDRDLKMTLHASKACIECAKPIIILQMADPHKQAMAKYLLGRNFSFENAIEKIKKTITETAEKIVDNMVDEELSQKDKDIATMSVINQVAALYLTVLDNKKTILAEQIRKQIDNKNPESTERLVNIESSYAEGILFSQVDKVFEPQVKSFFDIQPNQNQDARARL